MVNWMSHYQIMMMSIMLSGAGMNIVKLKESNHDFVRAMASLLLVVLTVTYLESSKFS